MILYRVVILEWAQRRDFFPAQIIAMEASSEKSQMTAEEVLAMRYPTLPDMRPTIDPDFGAAGDWHVLKDAIKGKGQVPDASR